MTCDNVDIGDDGGADDGGAALKSVWSFDDSVHRVSDLTSNGPSTRQQDSGDGPPLAQTIGAHPNASVYFGGTAPHGHTSEESLNGPTMRFGLADDIIALAVRIRQGEKSSVSGTRCFNVAFLI
jgi:hypothetical protein